MLSLGLKKDVLKKYKSLSVLLKNNTNPVAIITKMGQNIINNAHCFSARGDGMVFLSKNPINLEV